MSESKRKLEDKIIEDLSNENQYLRKRAEEAEKREHEKRVWIFMILLVVMAFGGGYLAGELGIPNEIQVLLGFVTFGGLIYWMNRG